MKNRAELYDFRTFGKAIKEARKARGWTRDRLSSETGLAPRYIVSIENEGQHPSLQVFYELVTLFGISVDQFFFPDKAIEKSTMRRRMEGLLDRLTDREMIILEAAAKGIIEAGQYTEDGEKEIEREDEKRKELPQKSV